MSHAQADGNGEVFLATTALEDYWNTTKPIVFRRSLYVVQDLKAGDVLTRENVRAIRPGLGLPTKYLPMLLGRSIKKDQKKGAALTWDSVD